jgi:methionyl-tRNA synthetase
MRTGWLALVVLSMAASVCVADDAPAGANSQANAEKIVSEFRNDLQAKSADIMAKTLKLSADEAAKFWPLYQQYQKEQSAIVDGQTQATQRYAEHYTELSDKEALAYVNALLERDEKIHDLRVKWLAKFGSVVPSATAARAIQVERRLGLVTQVGISSQVPLVR